MLASLGAPLVLAVPFAARAGKGVDGVVNLNTAPPEILGLLPGIGPAKAAQILAYRKRRPFRTVDELVRIKGIGRKMVRGMRAHLAIAGPTTAHGVMTGVAAVSQPPPPAPAKKPVAPALLKNLPLCRRPSAPPRQRSPPRATHGACLGPT